MTSSNVTRRQAVQVGAAAAALAVTGDAVETVSEHLIATHVHDNRGRLDDHLLPFDGTIDWAGTLLAVQKVGYDGPFMFEIVPNGSTKETLARARATRQRIEALLAES